jgi:hypothetical protein
MKNKSAQKRWSKNHGQNDKLGILQHIPIDQDTRTHGGS